MTQLGLLPHDGRTRSVHTSEEFDVYAGRGPNNRNMFTTPVGQPGWLGNPWLAWEEAGALDMFRRDFMERISKDEAFRAAVLALRGKRLGCPGCPTGSPCHARIIAEWIEAQPTTNATTTGGSR